MKKLFLMLMLMFAMVSVADAQTYYYRTTGFAIKYMGTYGWGEWSDWQKSNMMVTIDYDNDVVRIFSPQRQTYRITNYLRRFTDDSGGKQVEFKFIDQDGDTGSMRFRIETNGNSQLYVCFDNVIWVYNLVKTD